MRLIKIVPLLSLVAVVVTLQLPFSLESNAKESSPLKIGVAVLSDSQISGREVSNMKMKFKAVWLANKKGWVVIDLPYKQGESFDQILEVARKMQLDSLFTFRITKPKSLPTDYGRSTIIHGCLIAVKGGPTSQGSINLTPLPYLRHRWSAGGSLLMLIEDLSWFIKTREFVTYSIQSKPDKKDIIIDMNKVEKTTNTVITFHKKTGEVTTVIVFFSSSPRRAQCKVTKDKQMIQIMFNEKDKSKDKINCDSK